MPQPEFTGGIIGIMGDPKTCKTTWLLTAPTPILHIDLDNGIARAIGTFKGTYNQLPINHTVTAPDLAGFDLISIPFQFPVQWPGQKTQNHTMIANLIDTIFKVVCEVPWIASVAVDTGTVLWPTLHNAHLESLQLKNSNRESLIPVEYGPVNTKMRSYFTNVIHSGKNLIISHHIRDVRQEVIVKDKVVEQKIGETWDGWSKLEGLVDVLIRTRVENRAVNQKGQMVSKAFPYIEVVRCGWSLDAVGQRVDDFSFDGLLKFVNQKRKEQ